MGLFDKFKKMSPMAKAVSVGAAVGGAVALGPALLAAGIGKVAAAAGAALLGAGAASSRQGSSQNQSPYNRGRGIMANSVNEVPDYCRGEYRVKGPDGRDKYIGAVVGATRSLQDRARDHERSGMFNPANGERMQCFCARDGATAEQIYDHERASIAKHDPQMNKCKGGNGRR